MKNKIAFVLISAMLLTGCASVNKTSSGNSGMTGEGTNNINNSFDSSIYQNITSAKCYKVEFQDITENDASALFKVDPQIGTDEFGRTTFTAGNTRAWLSTSSCIGEDTFYYSLQFMTAQGNDYDTAANGNYIEFGENKDWDFLSASEAKKAFAELTAGYIPTETDIDVYAISADSYSEVVKRIKNMEDNAVTFEEKKQDKEWANAADYYFLTIRQAVNGIPIYGDLLGNVDVGTQTWGPWITAVFSKEGLEYLWVSSPYKVTGEVETSEEIITYSEAEKIFQDRNDSFLTAEEITLQSVELVYAILRAEDNGMILTPAWLFRYNNRELFMINAYTGEEIV